MASTPERTRPIPTPSAPIKNILAGMERMDKMPCGKRRHELSKNFLEHPDFKSIMINGGRTGGERDSKITTAVCNPHAKKIRLDSVGCMPFWVELDISEIVADSESDDGASSQ